MHKDVFCQARLAFDDIQQCWAFQKLAVKGACHLLYLYQIVMLVAHDTVKLKLFCVLLANNILDTYLHSTFIWIFKRCINDVVFFLKQQSEKKLNTYNVTKLLHSSTAKMQNFQLYQNWTQNTCLDCKKYTQVRLAVQKIQNCCNYMSLKSLVDKKWLLDFTQRFCSFLFCNGATVFFYFAIFNSSDPFQT